MYFEQARRQHGLTLIELILFIVIVGVAVVGVLQVLGLTTKNSADPLRRKQALMIAEGLLEEVQLARFTYCDPDDDNAEDAKNAGECASVPEQFGPEPTNVTRPFDNVNDYVLQANDPRRVFDNAAGRLLDANGDEIAVAGYTAFLTITPAPLGPVGGTIGATGISADTDVLRITVEVTYDSNQRLVLDGYRTRYAPKFH